MCFAGVLQILQQCKSLHASVGCYSAQLPRPWWYLQVRQKISTVPATAGRLYFIGKCIESGNCKPSWLLAVDHRELVTLFGASLWQCVCVKGKQLVEAAPNRAWLHAQCKATSSTTKWQAGKLAVMHGSSLLGGSQGAGWVSFWVYPCLKLPLDACCRMQVQQEVLH